MTNPSRRASKGRGAHRGSLACDSACIFANPASAMGVMAASAPPTITASAAPSRMSRRPSAMAWADAAHAVLTHVLGPWALKSMDMWPAAMLGIIIGMKYGLTQSGPRPNSLLCCSSRVSRPPRPALMQTPRRSGRWPRPPGHLSTPPGQRRPWPIAPLPLRTG